MMTVEDFLLAVYSLVDSLLQPLILLHTNGKGLRPGRVQPLLSDSEVITMVVVGEFLGFDTDKRIWGYFKEHHRALFPRLGHRTTFLRQAANLWWFIGELQHLLATRLGALWDETRVIDGFPMVLANINRASRTRSFRGEASRGYCAAKKQHFYGFRGHLIIALSGVVTACTVTAANVDERHATWEVLDEAIELLLGDKGYLSRFFASLLKEERGVTLWTRVRKNMAPSETPWLDGLFGKVRRRIETVIGQLVDRFHLGRVRARDRWHLTERVNRKILSHTIGMHFLKQMGIDSMELEEIVDF
jgi:hypothetical protein